MILFKTQLTDSYCESDEIRLYHGGTSGRNRITSGYVTMGRVTLHKLYVTLKVRILELFRIPVSGSLVVGCQAIVFAIKLIL